MRTSSRRHSLAICLVVVGLGMSACGSKKSSTDSVASNSGPVADDTTASAGEDTTAASPDPAPDTSSAAVSPATETVETSPATAVVSVAENPGQSNDGFVGALADVKVKTCAKNGASWNIDGTVSNPTAANAKYRIYVALNTVGTTDTKALVQVDAEVGAGATKDWATTAAVDADNLTCILRVERSA